MRAALKSMFKKNITMERTLQVIKLRDKVRDSIIMPFQIVRLNSALLRIPKVRALKNAGSTSVEEYWGEHTINACPFFTAKASLEYIDTLDKLYPLYYKYCGLYENKSGKIHLEYGCGPGNDVLGWMLYGKPKRLIAMDISRKALEMARRRLALHVDEIDPSSVEFIQVSDNKAEIPQADNSVDTINCLGVLHHTSNPDDILREFLRVLKPGGEARLMLYHADSLYIHLCVAYELQVQQGFHPEMNVFDAYEAISDGGAPHSRCTTAEAFVNQANMLGFEASFVGAAYNTTELDSWKRVGLQAMNDERLKPEHREFLRNIAIDSRGYPMYKGREAGLDAVFSLKKPVR